MNNKYQAQFGLILVGSVLVASPLFLRLPSQFQAFKTTTQLAREVAQARAEVKASEDIERERIEQRKETADTLKRTGVLPTGQKLKIRLYYDNPKKDPKPDVTGFLAEETVFVYDSAGVCVGRIQGRKWLWKKYFPYVCNNPPSK